VQTRAFCTAANPNIEQQARRLAPLRKKSVWTMATRRYQVFVETSHGRVGAGFSVPASATPVDVSLILREKGWTAYRIRPDHSAFAWIATVMDWKRAA
jgi:hypothetical protein